MRDANQNGDIEETEREKKERQGKREGSVLVQFSHEYITDYSLLYCSENFQMELLCFCYLCCHNTQFKLIETKVHANSSIVNSCRHSFVVQALLYSL